MLVLDTNVLSEEIKAVPAPQVHAWLAPQNSAELFTTAICEAEILSGIAILPDGQRKRDFVVAARAIFALFAGRILPFESAAATAYSEIVAERRKLARPINDFDAQIAAITRSRGFAVVTRNVADFEGLGLVIIDPWRQ